MQWGLFINYVDNFAVKAHKIKVSETLSQKGLWSLSAKQWIIVISAVRLILSEAVDDLDNTIDFRGLKLLIETEIRLEAEERKLIEQNSTSDRFYSFLEKKRDEVTKMFKST